MNVKDGLPDSPFNVDLLNNLNLVEQVHVDIRQRLILTTEDRLARILERNLKYAEKRYEWMAPMGILLTILTTLVSSSFRDFGLNSATWQACYVLAGLVCVVWLVRALMMARKTKSVDDILNEITSKSSIIGGDSTTSQNE